MVAAIKQVVTVKPGGLIQIRSDQLRAGSRAEVIVLVPDVKRATKTERSKNGRTKATKSRRTRTARLSKQDRGDIAESLRRLAEPGPNIPWEQIKAERGL